MSTRRPGHLCPTCRQRHLDWDRREWCQWHRLSPRPTRPYIPVDLPVLVCQHCGHRLVTRAFLAEWRYALRRARWAFRHFGVRAWPLPDAPRDGHAVKRPTRARDA